MTWWDRMAGQRLAIAGVEQDPRTNVWNFVSGVSAVYNAATKAWDLTVSGGGGGTAHTIQEEGSSLTQRAALNFVGPNVTVTDTGGKTTVSIPAITLSGSGVTGTLPYTRGGTGLGGLGSALQVLRTNAAGTATEWATVTFSGGTGDLKADGTVSMTADLNLGGNQASNAGDAVASTDLTTLQQVNALLALLARRPIQAYTGASNDLAATDSGKFITSSHGSALSLRIRLQSAVTWLSETELIGANVGAGTLTITAEGGVTLNGSVTVAANGWWFAKRTASNTWQVFVGGSGTGLPVASATGQTVVWNGSAYVAGALDLADSDARTGQLPWANLATAIGSLGFTGLKSLAYTEFDNGNSGAGSKNIDWTNGQVQKITANGNATLTFGAPAGGVQVLRLKITQDATGGRVFTFPTIGGDAPPISTGAGDVTTVAIEYDGVSGYTWNYALVRNPDVSSAVGDRIAGSKIAPDFSAQDITTTGNWLATSGFVRWGVASGSGTGVRSAASTGDMRLPRGGWTMWGRNNLDNGDALLIQWDSVNGRIVLGDSSNLSTGYIYMQSGLIQLRVGTNSILEATSTKVQPQVSAISWGPTIPTAPTITQDDTTAGSGTGKPMLLRAQSCTGATSTGGALDVGPGAGSSVGGLGRLMSGGTTPGGGSARFSWNNTGLSFFGATCAAKPTITGSRGGNAALASLLTELATLGLITDGTSA